MVDGRCVSLHSGRRSDILYQFRAETTFVPPQRYAEETATLRYLMTIRIDLEQIYILYLSQVV